MKCLSWERWELAGALGGRRTHGRGRTSRCAVGLMYSEVPRRFPNAPRAHDTPTTGGTPPTTTTSTPTPISGCLPTCPLRRRRKRKRRRKKGQSQSRSVWRVESEPSPGQNPGQGGAGSQRPKIKGSQEPTEWGLTSLSCLPPAPQPALVSTSSPSWSPNKSLPHLSLPYLPSALRRKILAFWLVSKVLDFWFLPLHLKDFAHETHSNLQCLSLSPISLYSVVPNFRAHYFHPGSSLKIHILRSHAQESDSVPLGPRT